MPQRQQLVERSPLRLLEAQGGRAAGEFDVLLITPGWGSSGYYSRDVLESAAANRVFAAGTHMYLDHPSASEQFDRPERSVRDLAAVLTEDARSDPDTGGLRARARVFGPYRDVLAEMADVIGVSIRADGDMEMGEAEGRRGRIITNLEHGKSVDFVTHAGRGGRILEVLESALPSAVVGRVVERAHGELAEASASDTRDALQGAVTAAYGGDGVWLGVRDFDPDARTVVYQQETPDGSATYEHAYTLGDDGTVTLTGDPVEVRAETRYVPVTPAGDPTTQESLEDTMPQIEEAQLRQLEEAAGRVEAAEARATAAEAALAVERTRSTARPIVAGVLAESQSLPASVQATVVESVLVGLPGGADETAIRTAATEARTARELEAAAILEAAGVGRVRGLGGEQKPPTGDGEHVDGITESEADRRMARAFGRTVKEA